MNSSGEAVVPLLKYYKVPPSRLLVIYDDLDIDVAALRLRTKGGHGGHNGMRSIITCLSGSQDFPRLRIGIGRPSGQRSVADHVLTTFDKREDQEVQARPRWWHAGSTRRSRARAGGARRSRWRRRRTLCVPC